MKVYTDSSFLVAFYLLDSRSEGAWELLTERPQIWVTPLHEAELAHAFAQQRFRGNLSEAEYLGAKEHFEQDLVSGLWVRVSLPADTFKTCAVLAYRHVIRFGGRTLDSLHVAAAMELGADQFWTFDIRQRRLAEAEHFRVRGV